VAGRLDAEDHWDEFVRALPPVAFLAELRAAAEMAVPVDRAGEGIAARSEAARQPVEVLPYPQAPSQRDLPPLVVVRAVLQPGAEPRQWVRHRALQAKQTKSDALDAVPDGSPGLLPPEELLQALPTDEAERREPVR